MTSEAQLTSSNPSRFRVDARFHEQLDRIAEQQSRSGEEVVSDAIEEYVDRAERRAKLLVEMEQAHEEYKKTGLHLTQQEVDDWMKTRRVDRNAPMPKLHT